MSTLEQWRAIYETEIRPAYPWLPNAMFTAAPVAQAFFSGFDVLGQALFWVPVSVDANRSVMWHEAGHAAHSLAAIRRDAAEGRGTAGDDIANEIAAILTPGRLWTEPLDPLYKEYVAEAFRKANTGMTGPMGYSDPPGQVVPFPIHELAAYFKTMSEPRVAPADPPVIQPPAPEPAPVVTPAPENPHAPTSGPTAPVRTMYDSTTASDIPADARMVAGYIDGWYRWRDEDWGRFPYAVKVRIAIHAATDDGHVLDVEWGAAEPGDVPGWVARRRAAGSDPSVYVNRSNWQACKDACAQAGVAEPHWWLASYGSPAEVIEGTVAVQYANEAITGKHYDLSAVSPYWPGVDEGGDMFVTREEFEQYKRDLQRQFNETVYAPLNDVVQKAHDPRHTHKTGEPEAA